MVGTPADDVIVGLGGNDYIQGVGGNDLICGDGGNDRIKGGDGNDSLSGGDGHDYISGDAGQDTILGDGGNDYLLGNSGDDGIFGGPDADAINGGSGVDNCHEPGADSISGCESFLPPSQPPTDILLDGTVVEENQPVGTIVGQLSAVDPNPDDTHTFALAAGSGDDDNSSFEISGNELQTSVTLDFETSPSLSIRVQATDSAGDTFEKQFTITVNDVSEPPIANADSFDAIGNTGLFVGTAVPSGRAGRVITGSVLDNDTDPDTPEDQLVVQPVTNAATTLGGTVSIEADGNFTYHPDDGDTGVSDSFSYRVCDASPCNASTAANSTGTVNLLLSGQVWYVDNSADAGGDGTSDGPFDTLAEAESASDAGDTVYVFEGSGSSSGLDTGYLMASGERLIGEHAGLSLDPDGAGTLPEVDLHAATGGAHPTLTAMGQDVVSLAGGNLVQGIEIDPAGAGSGISGGSGDSGGVIDHVRIIDTGTPGSQPALELDGTSGTFDISNLTVDNTGAGGSSAGVLLNNAGTVEVSGSSNTIDTGSGRALHVSGTTIGSGDLTFERISSNGAQGGILLNQTGASGSLIVTGAGGTCTFADKTGCSGGRIRNSTGGDDLTDLPVGAGIVLKDTLAPSFTRMWIHDHANYGIRGTNVTGFELIDSVIDGANGNSLGSAGNDPEEASIRMVNLLDSATILRSDISGGHEDNVLIVNNTGTLDRLTVTDTDIQNNSSGGNDGFRVESQGSSAVNITVENSRFSAHRGDHLDAGAIDSSTLDLVFTRNTMTGGHASPLGQSFVLSNSGSSDVTFQIEDNSIAGAIVSAMTLFQSASSTSGSSLIGTFNDNAIGTTGVAGSGSSQGNGLVIEGAGSGTVRVSADNNTVRQWSNSQGILVQAGEGSPALDVTLTNNTIVEPNIASFPANGFHLNAGTTSAGVAEVCLALADNHMESSGAVGATDFRLRQRNNSIVRLPGYMGGAADHSAVIAFVQGNNVGTPSGSIGIDSEFGGGASCATP